MHANEGNKLILRKTNWINAETSTPTATAAEELSGPNVRLTVRTTATGSPSQASVGLEGSIDGTNWELIAYTDANDLGGLPRTLDIAKSPLYRFVRLNFTNLSGGTNPTVSSSLIAYE